MDVDSLTFKIHGKTILDSVSFSAADEVLGIAGPNGSGKSTLLRAIESAAWKKHPNIELRSAPGQEIPAVGFLPQRFALPKELTVQEYIEYAAWVKNVRTVSASAKAAIKATQLDEFSGQKIRRVSGGVAQRAGFASVLVDEPEILLLDEPTTGVDMKQRDIMRGIIAAHSSGRVTIMSSHITEDLEQLCDRVLVLSRAKVQFFGTVAEATTAAGTSSFSDALLALSGGDS